MATSSDLTPLTGHCTCKALRYTLTAPPLVTHCCHCTFCQRETGSAFAINAVIECYNFSITSEMEPVLTNTPSPSSPAGDKYIVARCPESHCRTPIFAHYEANKSMTFVRAGTLDDASRQRVKPDVHIFTSTKLDWVNLEAEERRGAKVCEVFYKHEDVWSRESLERRVRLRAWRAEQSKGEE